MLRRALFVAVTVALCVTPVCRASAASLTSLRGLFSRHAVSTPTNVQFTFVTPSGVQDNTATMTVAFPSAYDLSAITVSDVALSYGPSTGLENLLALSSAADLGVWGLAISSNTLTFHAPLDAAGDDIPAGSVVAIRIGTNAPTGVSQIVNPTTASSTYRIVFGGTYGDSGAVIAYVGADAVSVSATVPAISGGSGGGGGGGDTGGGGATNPPGGGDGGGNNPPPVESGPTDPGGGDNPLGGDGGGDSGSGSGNGSDAGSGNGAGSNGGGTSGGGASGGTSGGGGTQQVLSIGNVRVVALSQDSVLLQWQTSFSADSTIEYGLTSVSEQRVASARHGTQHEVRLSGLRADTEYRFRISASGNGQSVRTTEFRFRTASDVTPPANARSFTAEGQQQQVALVWTLPSDSDFQDVVVIGRTDRYPVTVDDGRYVYTGTGTFVLDAGLLDDQEYFYALFARDRRGNTSSGVLARAKTLPRAQETTTSTLPSVTSTTSSSEPPIPVTSAYVVQGIRAELLPSGFVAQQVNGEFFVLAQQSFQISIDERAARVSGDGPERQRIARAELVIDGTRYAMNRANGALVTTVEHASGPFQGVLDVVLDDSTHVQRSVRFQAIDAGRVLDEQDQPIAQAEVTLQALVDGVWQTWQDSAQFSAAVQSTTQAGTYVYVVPDGRYRLLVRAQGYEPKDVEVSARGGIVSASVKLTRTSVVAQTIDAVKSVLQSPQVQQVSTKVVAPAAGVVAVASVAGTAASSAGFASYLYFLFTQPLLLFRRGKRRGTGLVYHALTKRPLDLVSVRLLDIKTGRVIQTRVTDAQGRFGFFVKPGVYRIEAQKKDYVFPSVYLKELEQDGTLLDVYHGEPIRASQEAMLAVNIPLDPVDVPEVPIWKLLWKERLRSAQSWLGGIGIVAALFALASSPSWFTGAVVLFQVVAYALFYRLARGKKPDSWGVVYDDAKRTALGKVIVRIFDKKYNKLLETQVTNSKGRYAFYVGKSEYLVLAEKPGYERSMVEVDARQAPEPIVREKISLVPASAKP